MLLSKFRDSIENLTFPLNDLPNSLLLQENQSLTIYYAPFDYINLSAKIVICGITPGLQHFSHKLLCRMHNLTTFN